ncbi:MAG: hypothetical protein IKO77_03790 [Bacteroidales bacterium]|nr:hypothetical protein [Bacteroidales bacterium]
MKTIYRNDYIAPVTETVELGLGSLLAQSVTPPSGDLPGFTPGDFNF